MARAIEKYGWDAFETEVVADGLTKEESDRLEKYLISKYQTSDRKMGYNIQSGGMSEGEVSEAGMIAKVYKTSGKNNYRATPCVLFDKSGKRIKRFETVSEAARFLGVSTTVVSGACHGIRIKTANGRIIFYEKDIGDIDQLSEEELHRILDVRRETKSVSQYSLDGEFIASYSSLASAERATGIGSPNICSVLSGSRNMSGGFQWRYGNYSTDNIGHAKIRMGSNIPNARPIAQIDARTGVEIATFECIKDVERKLGFGSSSICSAASGKTMCAYGYKWKYLDTGEN